MLVSISTNLDKSNQGLGGLALSLKHCLDGVGLQACAAQELVGVRTNKSKTPSCCRFCATARPHQTTAGPNCATGMPEH